MATVKINDPNIYAATANLTDRLPTDQGDNTDKTITVAQILALSLFNTTNTQVGGNLPTDPNIVYWFTTGDTAQPTITAFTLPGTSDSLAVMVTAFTASDNTAVTGYMVTQSATPPLSTDPSWSATPPAIVDAAAAGFASFYPWAKDAAGNVSAVVSPQTVAITLPNRTYVETFSENFDALSALPGTLSYGATATYNLAAALTGKGTGKVVTATWSSGGPAITRAITPISKGYVEMAIAFSSYPRILDLALFGNGLFALLFRFNSADTNPTQLKMSGNQGGTSINLTRPDASPANDFVDQYMRVRLEWDLSVPTVPVYTMKYDDGNHSWLTLTPVSAPAYATTIPTISEAKIMLYAGGGTGHLDYIKTGSWS